jgi:formylglycine-generating enzyme required for sulfatase activity
MRFIFLYIFCLLLVSGMGCSGNEDQKETSGGEPSVTQSEDSFPDAGSSVEVREKVIPVTLSPEDQAKAKLAPEGMVFIKGGCFIMGNDYAQEDEKPEHEVCLDDFYMDKYEVTQARWEKLLGFNPSKIVGPELPVEQVNYVEVQEFLEKSNGQCRLPTEAEWEYAAKGGANARYFWGNMMDEAYAWYVDGSAETTHPVGQKKPNQNGLYDMMGNVWEWTDDWYEPYYQIREKNNPKGPQTGEYKVIRGGAFDSSAGALRITNRIWLHPKNRVFPKVTTYGQAINEVYNYIGFRCAQSIPKQTQATETKAELAK